jgi:hypothetical protein
LCPPICSTEPSEDLKVINKKVGLVAALLCIPTYSMADVEQAFQPGTYEDAGGAVCRLNVAEFNSQRQQATLVCQDQYSSFTATWFTGPLQNHPFQLDLIAAKVESVGSAENLAWGKVGSLTAAWWGCMSSGSIISVTQVRASLQINAYGDHALQQCGTSLILADAE